MKIKQFVETYQAFENMQTLDIELPVSKKETPEDKVVRIGLRGVLPTSLAYAGWNDIIAYQRSQLKLYWKNYWQEMLDADCTEDLDCMYCFLRRNHGLILFMDEEWVKFLYAWSQKTQGHANIEVEDLLKSKYSEEVLLKNKHKPEFQEALTQLMTSKIVYFNKSLAFSTNYLLFIDWLPEWKEHYPMVWQAVAGKLKEMNDKGLIMGTLEERRLYNLYVPSSD